MNSLQKYIHLSKYARYLDKEKRRETWEETVKRYSSFWEKRFPELIIGDYKAELENVIYNMEVMPSMRTLMTAGKALERDEIAGYNCSAIAINHIRCFDEIFFLLMNGCGVGFSVEREYIGRLPTVSEEFYETGTIIEIRDSKIGWATGLRELISMLYSGSIPTWDTTKVRPAGARLKTFGGRASGPEPLEKLFTYIVGLFKRAKGRKLNSLECHDLCCKIAETVIVGSVRRAACISLSNLTDDRMRRAKMGEWFRTDLHRELANNGTAYTCKPDLDSFTKEMRNLHKSRCGERSIVNLVALKDKAEQCGRTEDYKGWFILNPCGEAILRATGGLCNLTEVVIRPEDTLEDLKRKVKWATILGTLQSTLTNFRYLRSIWQKNAEEERLLGVSLTGIMDHPAMSGKAVWLIPDPEDDSDSYIEPQVIHWLKELKEVAYETNKEWSDKLGIPKSKQLTLVKPSGTVSQLVNSSSGIHPRMFPYYIRNIRQDIKDPLTDLMRDEGVPWVQMNNKIIFKFPMKSPKNAVTQENMTALEQLELWKIYREYWCEGNPSQTIYYSEDEYFEMCSWVWKNWDIIGGISFFPKADCIYEHQPYEDITKEEYEKSLETFPREIRWDRLPEFEKEDQTTSVQEYACVGGNCDL